MKGEAYEGGKSRVALRFWGQRLVLLGVLGRSGREMEFGLVNVKFETPVPHSKRGIENMHSERGQGTVLDSTEPIR